MRLEAPLSACALSTRLRALAERRASSSAAARLSVHAFRLDQVAQTDATVLLLGETGTGKGMAAQLVHSLSPRSRRPVHQRRLHVAAGDAHGERAVRAREGRLHRRAHDTGRPVRNRQRRHDLPRRDWRAAAGRAVEAPAGAAAWRVRAARLAAHDPRGRPRRGGDQSEPRRRGEGRPLPSRSVLPPQCLSDYDAAAS